MIKLLYIVKSKLKIGVLNIPIIIMYCVNFYRLKSLELTNDQLEIRIWKETLIWGSPCDATINIDNALLQFNRKLDFNPHWVQKV
jgi:hypothetical protein